MGTLKTYEPVTQGNVAYLVLACSLDLQNIVSLGCNVIYAGTLHDIVSKVIIDETKNKR